MMIAQTYDALELACNAALDFASQWKARRKIQCEEKDLGWEWTLYDECCATCEANGRKYSLL